MNVRLIAVAIAAMGLAACGPDIKPATVTESGSPEASTAPVASPAAPDEKQVAQTAPAATADSGKAAEGAPSVEPKTDAAAPVAEGKPGEGAKQAD